MLASMKRQFTELLSDIGFVQEGLTVRHLERMARGKSGDGIAAATGHEVTAIASFKVILQSLSVL